MEVEGFEISEFGFAQQGLFELAFRFVWRWGWEGSWSKLMRTWITALYQGGICIGTRSNQNVKYSVFIASRIESIYCVENESRFATTATSMVSIDILHSESDLPA